MEKGKREDSEAASGGSETGRSGDSSAFSFSPFSIFPCLFRAVIVGLVRLYQYTLGALLPNSCRFTPSCSQYCIQAVRKHGALKGSWLGLKRVLRCNPYCRGGHDPVP